MVYARERGKERKASKLKEENRAERGTIRVMYTNIDGLLSCILEVRDYLRERKPDVLCLTETKLRDEIHLCFKAEGYNMWRRDRKEKGGGGLLVLTKEEIYVEEVQYGVGMTEVISIAIRMREGEMRRIILTYVPPRTNAWGCEEYKGMKRELIRCLDDMIRKDSTVLLLGDFNSKEVNWEEMEVNGDTGEWGEDLLQLVMVNTMEQWVRENTRYRGEDEPTMLDLVFTKKPETCPTIEYLCPMGKSDHVVMEIELKGSEKEIRSEGHKNGRLNHAKANFAELREFYEKINWKEVMKGRTVQEKYDIFLMKYREGEQKYVPVYKEKKKRHKWYNARCAEAKRKKDAAWRKLKKHRNTSNRESYRGARNECVRIRREEERKFEKDIVTKCGDEPKLFYKYINEKIRSRDTIMKLIKEGRVYETSEEMSEVMNESFRTVFSMEEEFMQPRREETREGIHELQVEKGEIYKLMEKMDVRKAMGPDGVSGWILKECKEQLVEPIWDIINSSLKEGKVPREWKRANIVPIYKGGKRTEPLNYRPVSLTSVVGKLCEAVIKERWVKYLEEKEVITGCQYGFRKGRSCVTNLLSFYTRVRDVLHERDGWVDAVYLDIKKAFDRVPHRRLLWKLENVGGLKGKMLEWMKDYLQDRQMKTVIKDVSSSWCKVISGVPQGSVLAPIMFQVYINDMNEGLSSYINLFADDAKLLKVIKNLEDCMELQRDIDKIYEWSQKWKLEFNAEKCHVMEMGKSKRRPVWDYKMGQEPISKSKKEKDLGVFIQDTLSPGRHISGIFGSAYGLLGDIRVAFYHMDKDMMKKIITTMIRPRLEYAAVVWSPHMEKDIKKLERVQRVATKMVPELRDLTYEERLKEMELPTLQVRRERGDLIMMYKVVNGMEKIDRPDLVVGLGEQSRQTRGHSKRVRKSQSLRDIRKYSFPHRSVDVWNSLSEEVVLAANIHTFKERLDKYRYGDGTP